MKKIKSIFILLILSLNLVITASAATEISTCYVDPSLGFVEEPTGH